MKYMKNFLLFYDIFEVLCPVRGFLYLDPKKTCKGMLVHVQKLQKKKKIAFFDLYCNILLSLLCKIFIYLIF